MSARNPNGLRIAFLHPDLGIGGAERLVVDAAIALQQYGHIVHMFTSHHDDSHCFEETRTVGGSLKVIVAGDWLPRVLFGKFAIIFAILRGIWLSLYLLFTWTQHNPLIKYGNALYPANRDLLGEYDIVVTDQLSIYNLFLLFTPSRTIFYCHYPDLLLSKPEPNPVMNTLKRLYRIPINLLETVATGVSETVLVNSKFTGQTFAQTFPLLDLAGIKPIVLYPSIQMAAYDNNKAYDQRVEAWWEWYAATAKATAQNTDGDETQTTTMPTIVDIDELPSDAVAIESIPRETCVFVSINRFEIKKAVEQAIYGLVEVKRHITTQSKQSTTTTTPPIQDHFPFTATKLIIAGGYDPLVTENYQYHLTLTQIAESYQLTTSLYPDTTGDIIFLLSFSQSQRTSLLRRAQAIIYTPQNEHFGIVPIEAMYSSRSVIAHTSGGPLESIHHGVTGFVCHHADPLTFKAEAPKIPPSFSTTPTPQSRVDGTTTASSSLSSSSSLSDINKKMIAKYPVASTTFTFGSAMVALFSDPFNHALCINSDSNNHAIANFSIQVFAKSWNDVVMATNAITLQQTHWFKNFALNFGTSPFVRVTLLLNMALTVVLVSIYTLLNVTGAVKK